jgi:CcmD family protein
MTRRLAIALTALSLMVIPVGTTLASQDPQGQFVPVTPGAVQEAIPAAPFVFMAYGFVWAALGIYIVLLWRRLAKVEHELGDLNARLRASRRS